MKKSGFTLVEVLTVIAIIAILSLLILPNFIGSYNDASDKIMITQENQVVDAAKLFLEDYCKHPLSSNKGQCSIYSLETNESNKKYTCLSVLQLTSYLDPIKSKGDYCSGFVVYEKDYTKHKTYLKCGNGYQTAGMDDIKDVNGNKIKDLCNDVIAPEPSTDPSNPTPSPTTNENYTNVDTGVKYEFLKDALAGVASNQTIKVLNNVTETATATLASGKTGVKLNLNGKTITSSATNVISNNGQLDVYNSSTTEGSIKGSGSCVIYNAGTFTTNATFSSNKITINNTGAGRTYRVLNNYTASSSATLNTNSTLISSTATSGARYVINNSGSLIINGATIIDKVTVTEPTTTFNDGGPYTRDNGIYLDGTSATVKVNSGTFDIGCDVIVNAQSTSSSAVIVNGGTLTSLNCHAVANKATGTATIAGGTLTSNQSCTRNYETGTIVVTGGTLTGSYGVNNTGSGNVIISGGSINSKKRVDMDYGYGISNKGGGTVTVTGGTITGVTHGIYNYTGGTVTIGKNDSEIKTNTPIIQTNNTADAPGYGLFNLSDATFNFYDGVIKSPAGTGYSLRREPNSVPTDYYVYKETVSGVESAILVGKYYNINSGKSFSTLSAALSAVASSQTIKVMTNTTETTNATLISNKSGIKLDLNGKTITMSNSYISNAGGLDIYNTSSTAGSIKGGANYVLYNTGSLSLNNTSSTNKVLIEKTSSNSTTAGSVTCVISNATSSATFSMKDNVEVTASGGTSHGIDNDGMAKILAGKVTGTNMGVENGPTGKLYLGLNDGNVSTTSPSILGIGSYGLNNAAGDTYFYDGVVKSQAGSSYAYHHTDGFGSIFTPTSYVLKRSISSNVESAYLVR